jgi:hypothetical protein
MPRAHWKNGRQGSHSCSGSCCSNLHG